MRRDVREAEARNKILNEKAEDGLMEDRCKKLDSLNCGGKACHVQRFSLCQFLWHQ